MRAEATKPLESARQIASEIHEGYDLEYDATTSCSTYSFRLPKFSGNQQSFVKRIAKFLQIADQSYETQGITDNDGDLDPPRRALGLKIFGHASTGNISLHHHATTNLQDVGLQVWKGAFLLADLAFSLGPLLTQTFCLELGSGTGLVGICLSMLAKIVITTDTGEAVLTNCEANVRHHSSQHHTSPCLVRELDWRGPYPWRQTASSSTSRYCWQPEDVKELSRTQLLWAADVIYDPDTTRDFLACACEILLLIQDTGSTAFLVTAMEARINLAIGDTCPRAHAIDDFVESVQDTNRSWTQQNRGYELCMQEFEVDQIPQWFDYTRGNNLALWILHIQSAEIK